MKCARSIFRFVSIFFYNGCCQLAGCCPVKKALLSFLNDILNYHEMMDDADALSGDSLGTYLWDYGHVFSGEAYFHGTQQHPSNGIKCEKKTKLQCTKEVHVYVI